MTDRVRKPAMTRATRRGPGSPLTTLADPLENALDAHQGTGCRTATAVVEDISPDGTAMVVVAGQIGLFEASSLMRFPTPEAAVESLLGRTVLVVIDESRRPVILGVVADRLWDTREGPDAVEAQAALPPGEAVAVHADKRRIDLEATDEIRLTCGKSSLVLRSDGTVIVRGVTIVSRALQAHKIRGATVSVN